MYFFRKPNADRPTNGSIKAMHIINATAIFVFLLGLTSCKKQETFSDNSTIISEKREITAIANPNTFQEKLFAGSNKFRE